MLVVLDTQKSIKSALTRFNSTKLRLFVCSFFFFSFFSEMVSGVRKVFDTDTLRSMQSSGRIRSETSRRQLAHSARAPPQQGQSDSRQIEADLSLACWLLAPVAMALAHTHRHIFARVQCGLDLVGISDIWSQVKSAAQRNEQEKRCGGACCGKHRLRNRVHVAIHHNTHFSSLKSHVGILPCPSLYFFNDEILSSTLKAKFCILFIEKNHDLAI